jgi:Collagenase and related proteases
MKPELLAPAGSEEALHAAVQAGADAVYLGAGAFNARQTAGQFDGETLRSAVEYAHARGVKVYVTLNTLVREDDVCRA